MATDRELSYASQIAYSNDLKNKFEELKTVKGTPVSLYDLCDAAVSKEYPKPEDVLKHIIPDINNDDVGRIMEWSMVTIYDNNSVTIEGHTGYYGCMLDTGSGEAIIASRGSEGMTNLDNLVNDWFGADLGLMNSELTAQQADVDVFLKRLQEEGYLDQYDKIDLTGHSLGGNLAMHGAVSLAELGYADKISRCVNFDGPGNSEEYLEKHHDAIEKVNDKVTHYYWSLVGKQLSVFPGVERQPLGVKEKDDFLYNIVGKHDLKSIDYNGDGSAKKGQPGLWEELCSKFSQGVDHLPAPVGNLMLGVVESTMYASIWLMNEMLVFKDGKIQGLSDFGKTVLVSIVALAIAVGPVAFVGHAIMFAATVIFVVVLTFFAVIAFEYIYEFIETVINEIANYIESAFNWVKEKANEFREAIVNGLNSIKNWFKSLFGGDGRSASLSQYIKLDTYKLRSYAQRLSAVNRRIANLDRRLDGLYWQVGLLDLWNLITADLLTSYSWRIARCSEYLNATASEFESAESSLISSL